MTRCYLSGISYELGELFDLGDIPELIEDEGLLEVFRVRGLERYARSELSAFELGRRCAARALTAAAVAPESVDVVLYATDHLAAESLYTRPEINRLLCELGLVRAFPIGVSLSGCTNFAVAIELAAALIHTKAARRIQLLIVEKLHGPAASRLLDLGMSVVSDGAVSCVLGDEPGDFEVRSVGRYSEPELDQLSLESDLQRFFAATGKGFRQAVERALAPLHLSQSQITRLFTNNYASHIQKVLIEQAGFARQQCYFDNIARFAHLFSADTLINLADCAAAGGLAPGDRCVLLGSSPTSWGAVVVEKR